jgi:hypothetical protein
MKTSEPLSPAARRLLELGSLVEPPTAQQCERMDRALAPLFGAGRLAPLADATSRPSASRGAIETEAFLGRPREKLAVLSRAVRHRLGLGSTKLVLAVGALAATAGASFWLGRVWTPPAEPREMSASFLPSESDALARSAAPAASELAPSPESSTLEAPSTLEASSTPKTGADDDVPLSASSTLGGGVRSRPGARDKPRPSTGLAAEIERMARVEAALRQGRPARARDYLDQRKAEHLVEQAEALRAVADCQSGLESSAVRAEQVLRRWPASAFQSRIRDACGL